MEDVESNSWHPAPAGRNLPPGKMNSTWICSFPPQASLHMDLSMVVWNTFVGRGDSVEHFFPLSHYLVGKGLERRSWLVCERTGNRTRRCHDH